MVAALAQGHRRRGHQVRVVALLGEGETCLPFASLPAAGVELIELRFPPRSYRAEFHRVTELLRTLPDAVVHTHGYHADVVGLRAARAAHRPAVATVHGYTGGGFKNRVLEWLDRRALARFDAVVPVSRPLSALLERSGVAGDRLHLIPNAYAGSPPMPRAEARRRLGLPGDVPVVGWVGRLTHEKGPDLFLEALALVPEWHAAILGAGAMESALKERARALGVENRISWHGIVPDAGTLLAGFDAVMLSSRTEGTPIVLLEAMAAGASLVVTEVGGIPDVVSSDEAILVAPDQPALLAHGLRRIAAEPEAARVRTEQAQRRLALLFGIDPWLDRYEAIYRLFTHGTSEPSP